LKKRKTHARRGEKKRDIRAFPLEHRVLDQSEMQDRSETFLFMSCSFAPRFSSSSSSSSDVSIKNFLLLFFFYRV